MESWCKVDQTDFIRLFQEHTPHPQVLSRPPQRVFLRKFRAEIFKNVASRPETTFASQK
jgi:hypothetical protein